MPNTASDNDYAAAWLRYVRTEKAAGGYSVTNYVVQHISKLCKEKEAGEALVVDLGCGNGELYHDLCRSDLPTFRYLGFDGNAALIDTCRSNPSANSKFALCDFENEQETNEFVEAISNDYKTEHIILTMVRVLNNLTDDAVARLLRALTPLSASTSILILDPFPAKLSIPCQDNLLRSTPHTEYFEGIAAMHYERMASQYTDYLTMLGVQNIATYAGFLREKTSPSHFTISGYLQTIR